MAERRRAWESRYSPTGPTWRASLELAADPLIAGFTTNPTPDAQGRGGRLRELRAQGPRPRHRSAGLLRGVLGRLRRDAASRRTASRRGATTCASRSRSPTPRAPAPPRWSRSWPPTASPQRHRPAIPRSGPDHGRVAGREPAGHRVGLRRPDRRHRPGPGPADGRGGRDPGSTSRHWSCCGPARGRSSTCARPSPSAATSSP